MFLSKFVRSFSLSRFICGLSAYFYAQIVFAGSGSNSAIKRAKAVLDDTALDLKELVFGPAVLLGFLVCLVMFIILLTKGKTTEAIIFAACAVIALSILPLMGWNILNGNA